VREQRVLDRQVMQGEALLHGAQQLLVRLVQPDPGEIAVGLGRTGFLQSKLGAAAAGFVGDAVDDGAHAPRSSSYPAPPSRARGGTAVAHAPAVACANALAIARPPVPASLRRTERTLARGVDQRNLDLRRLRMVRIG